MDRLRKDQWSACPNRVASSFKLPLLNGISPSIDTGSHKSGVCGFGWRFTFTAHKVEPDSTGSDVCQTRFDFQFDPHLIASAEFGTLSIIVTVTKSLAASGNVSHLVSIPRQNVFPIGSYISDNSFTGDAIVEIQVTFPDSLDLSFPDEFPSRRVQAVLQDSLIGDQMFDARFCLFSRRTIDRRPARPKIVFASSVLLLGYSSYLDTPVRSFAVLGASGFAESTQVDLDSDFSNNMQDDGYDYESDSDLDSEPDGEHRNINGGPVDLALPRAESRMSSASTTSQDSFHSSSMEQVDELGTSELEPRTEVVGGASSEHVEKKHLGRVILINDTAFTTWKALMVYLYTRELDFKAFKSDKKPLPKSGPHSPTMCSPKSMYRLADKIGLLELQTISLKGIRERLSADNILEEVFLKFSSLYPDVLEVQVNFLMAQLASTPEFLDRLLNKMKILVQESLPPHCFDAISSIMRRMHSNVHVLRHQDQGTTALPSTSPPSLFSGLEVFGDPGGLEPSFGSGDWGQTVAPTPGRGGRRGRGMRR